MHTSVLRYAPLVVQNVTRDWELIIFVSRGIIKSGGNFHRSTTRVSPQRSCFSVVSDLQQVYPLYYVTDSTTITFCYWNQSSMLYRTVIPRPSIVFLCLSIIGWIFRFAESSLTTKLECKEEPDGSVICQFHVKKAVSSVALSKSCVNGKEGNICLSGLVQITTEPHEQQQQGEQDQDQPLVVGKATYFTPFSQHGARVEAVLRYAPPLEDSPEWANWYLDLASAHYPNIDQNVESEEVWVQVELAINAYQQAIQAIKKLIDPTTEQESLLATVYYLLGEAYFLDPNLRYVDTAVEAYQESLKQYERVLTRLSPEDRRQTEMKLAEACTKLGMALLSSMDPMETAPSWMARMDATYKPQKTKTISHVQEYLERAMQIYEQHQNAPISQWDRNELQLSFAATIQQVASVAMMQGRLTDAKRQFVRSLAMQMVLLPKLSPAETQATHTSIADLLLSLADLCVQMGDYVYAKKTYQKAMGFHEIHKVKVAPMIPMEYGEDGMPDSNAAILDALAALKEYRFIVNNDDRSQYQRPYSDSLGAPSDKEYFYEKDDGYEGDLLATVGTLYLSLGDPRAILFLEQAFEKYSNSADDRESPAMADLLMNLAMAYYRGRQFQDSYRVYEQALDIYRTLYGDGVNPYEAMDDLMMMQQNMGDGFHNHNSKEQDGSFSMSSTIMKQEEDDLQEDTFSSITTRKGNDPGNAIPIDLEAYQRSIQNDTESEQQREIKEEL